MRKIDEKCRKLTENVPKYAYKMLLEAADSETKKIVSELSNHSFSKGAFSCSNRIELPLIRIDSGSNRSHLVASAIRWYLV